MEKYAWSAVIKDGKLVKKSVGARPKDEILALLD